VAEAQEKQQPERYTGETLPAWSLPAEAVERIGLPVTLPEQVTREWAWGGSTGAGVRVCILDSGIELDHPLVGRPPGELDGARDPHGAEAAVRHDHRPPHLRARPFVKDARPRH